MAGELDGVDSEQSLLGVARESHVILLIDSLELRVESSDHHVLEPVGLDFGPVLDLVGGDVLHVAGHVVGGVGVGALRADERHELVIFIGDGNLRSGIAHGVDEVIDGVPLGLVGLRAVNVIEPLDLVQHGLFGLEVGGAETGRALEHDVLEIVGQSGVVRRVVLSADPHGDIRLNPGNLFVYGHIDFQSVVQGVDFCPHGVSRNGLILAAGAGRDCDRGRGHQCQFE